MLGSGMDVDCLMTSLFLNKKKLVQFKLFGFLQCLICEKQNETKGHRDRETKRERER